MIEEAHYVGIAALVILGPLIAFGLRRLRVAGAAIAGGVLAGLIAGPAFFGRIAPKTYTHVFDGPPALLEALHLSQGALRAETYAAPRSAAQLDADELIERSAAVERDRRAWEDARVAHRQPFGVVALMGAIVILGSSFGLGARRAKPVVRDGLVAAWSALVPALAVVALVALRGEPILSPSTAMVAAACACGAWWVRREDRAIIRHDVPRSSRDVASIAALATTIACALALPALASAPSATTKALAIVALVIGAFGPLFPRLRGVAKLASIVVIPAVAALIAVQVDPAHDVSVVLVIVLFLIAEDVRWLGAYVGYALGDRGHSAMRQSMAGLGVGPTMLAFTALGVALQAIAAPLALALLVAAVLTDCFAPIRLRVARRLEEASAELDDASH